MFILSYIMLVLLCFLIPWLISQIIRFIPSFAVDPSFILTDSFIFVSHITIFHILYLFSGGYGVLPNYPAVTADMSLDRSADDLHIS